MSLAEKLALASLIMNGLMLPPAWWFARWVWRQEQRMRRAEYALGINEPVT